MSQLHSVEDVSAVASLVGHDVYVVAVANGQKFEKKMAEPEPGASEPLGRIEREYVFTQGIDDREVVVTASNGQTVISVRRRVRFGFHGYYHAKHLCHRLAGNEHTRISSRQRTQER
ncbi:MAG: hypothetical protein E6I93_19930 [Chloroflexi bacterium]|nr:MAG: hypothetical protein E6I93_19930 [Chloroflexota bacterium]